MRTTLAVLALVALVPSAVFGQNCYSCQNILTAGDCATLQGVGTIACPAGEAGCYRFEFEDGRVNRGCASSLTDTELTGCRVGTTGCKLCVGDLCNAKVDFQRCHRCDTLLENCPQLQAATDNLHTCTDYLDECGVQIVDGRTLRGCVREMNWPATCNALTCSACTDNYCNRIIFPITRLQCNSCSGTTDACFNEITGLALRRVCDNYIITGDTCFTAVDGQRTVHRGCRSDGGVGEAACAAGNCVACFAAGCNSVAARANAQLSCITCATNDLACAWGFPATEATTCVNQVYMGESESCLVRTMFDGSVQRGCYLDIFGNCAANDDTCELCTGNACNRRSFNAHTCYQCRSANEESCRTRVEEDLEPQVCNGIYQRLADQGCYTLTQDSGHVVRGCLHNLDTQLLADCRAGDRCEVCGEDGCNNTPVEGGAGALQALSVALLAVVAVCVQMF